MSRRMPKQIITIWPLQLTEAQWQVVYKLIERTRPQGVCIHADGYTLARIGRQIVETLRAKFPWLEFWFAIAGDWDRASIPGYSDGWEEACVVALATGVKVLQLNCERAWKARPKGAARAAINDIVRAIDQYKLQHPEADIELGHTTYGALSAIDRDPTTPGFQPWGGHGTYPTQEFLGTYEGVVTPIKSTNFQAYWSIKDGEHLPRGRGIEYARRYKASMAENIRRGLVAPHVICNVYLQAYDARTDELCLAAQDLSDTNDGVVQWWAVPSRLDGAGADAIFVMALLYELQLTIAEFQQLMGLKVDNYVGPLTITAAEDKRRELDSRAA